MDDLTREELAAFVALWPHVFVPFGLVTESTLKVLRALRELADTGGVLVVEPAIVPPTARPADIATPAPSPAPVLLTDDDIAF